MLNITQRLIVASRIDDYIELPFLLRQKSRLRVTTQAGIEAALYLDRGGILRDGDLLKSDGGLVLQIIAAQEPVYDVIADTPQLLTSAAYHLGNRHVPLQVGDGWLRLEQDHVLREMLIGLHTEVIEKFAPFEPEAGAYGGGHRHDHPEDNMVNLRLPTRQRHA